MTAMSPSDTLERPAPAGVATLTGVAETLLITLAARALGSAAHWVPGFADPTAEALCRRFEVDLARYAAHRPTVRGILLRGAWYDGRCADFLRRFPDGTVLNIGTGLNTAYERVAALVPGRTWRWIDSDLAPVMTLRRQVFEDDDRRSSLVLDATDTAAIGQILAGIAGPLLVLVEGVLMFLPPPAVQALFAGLADRPGTEVVFDWCSPAMMRRSRKHPALARRRDTSVVFQWSLRRPSDITGYDPRWRIVAKTNAPMVRASGMSAVIATVHWVLTGGRAFYGCTHARTADAAAGPAGS